MSFLKVVIFQKTGLQPMADPAGLSAAVLVEEL